MLSNRIIRYQNEHTLRFLVTTSQLEVAVDRQEPPSLWQSRSLSSVSQETGWGERLTHLSPQRQHVLKHRDHAGMIALSRKRSTAVLASGDGGSDFFVRMLRGTHSFLAERSHRRHIDGCRLRVQRPLALQTVRVWILPLRSGGRQKFLLCQ